MSIHSSSLCTVTVDNSGNVWKVGQLPTEMVSSKIPRKIEGINNVSQVCCSPSFVAFIDFSGDAWHLGHLLKEYASIPTKLEELTNIHKIACGVGHCLFLDTSGICYGAGTNNGGEIGNSKDSFGAGKAAPRHITDLTSEIIDIACGDYHSIFVCREGNVFGGGKNAFNQLGDKSTPKMITKIEYPEFIVSVCSGSYHTLCLSDTGNVWAMGSCSYGKLGINKSNGSYGIPGKVLFPEDVEIKYLSAGSNSSFAIDTNNSFWAFGFMFNLLGQYKSKIPHKFGLINNIKNIGNALHDGFLVKTDKFVIAITKSSSDCFGRLSYVRPFHVWEEQYYHLIGDRFLDCPTNKSARKG